ncbi:hypothetical protein J7384_06400 [Endozoicomonas sp. G2_1]|uniref:hypothetical protein n=1 Tax=Endozoicomonas sp. G2_1 TaxID=2821091 RepID=UPI001ADB39DD|nr:hypothetical protein [Endozoicomonas sp. G2_1]MBO9489988.1 hypothetical protein [Endozoicomonas sp. G2_1]
MSLTDLKKGAKGKGDKAEQDKKFTVDDFINDADNYAKGVPQLVSSTTAAPAGKQLQELELDQALDIAEQQHVRSKRKGDKPFRHATFTLSEQAIKQLSELAEETKLAKSHILRILINELASDEQRQRLTKLLATKID